MKRVVISMLGVLLAAGGLFGEEIDMTKYNPKVKPGLHSSTRNTVCINGAWKFMPIYDKEYLLLDEFPDPDVPPSGGEWSDILVPGLFRQGRGGSGAWLPDGSPRPAEWNKAHRGWYRREIDIPEEWSGKTVWLKFGSVAFYAKVFVNDKAIGEHKGPVTPFEMDITDAVKFGRKNTVWVYVIDQQKLQYCPEGVRGYAAFGQAVWHILPEVWEYRSRAAGIWKDVFVEARSKVFVDDIFAMPSYRNMEITGRTWVKNTTEAPLSYLLVLDILDTEGNEVLEVGRADVATLRGETVLQELSTPWQNPKLWDLDQPNLYYMRARLLDYTASQTVVDEKLVRFGFKEAWVDKDQIYLNGRIIHLFGDWVSDNGLGSPEVGHRPEYYKAKYKSLREDIGFVSPRQIGHGWETAYEAADEVGFLLTPTGYAGNNIDSSAYEDCANEWTEYIKSLRNHPSVLIYSIQNESLQHIKTVEFFVLQRRLDHLVETLDPTRPYYHDGHVQRNPEDPGVHYENGDMSGNAPVAGGHYTCPNRPMSRWIHEFDLWRRAKPYIYGEAGTFSPRDIKNFGTTFYGDVYSTYDAAKRMDLGGKVVKMVTGAWRSYAVPGLMIHSTYQNSSYKRNPKFKDPTLVWNDLETPGAKPFHIGAVRSRFNPYQPDNDPMVPNAHAKWMKKAFAPLLVTLYRDLRHNFTSGTTAEKDLYVVNDTREDAKVKLTWELSKKDGEVLAKAEEETLVPQGRPKKLTHSFKLPRVSEPEILQLTVNAETADGKLQAEDDQELTVYPEDPAPKLKKDVYVYGEGENLLEKLKKAGVKARPFEDGALKGKEDRKIVVVSSRSFDEDFGKKADQIDAFIRNGGVLIVLDQKVDLWETDKEVTRGRWGRSNLWLTSLDNPLFRGLAEQRVYFWAGRHNLLADISFTIPEAGNYTKFLDNYLFEMAKGKGLLVGCSLLLAEKYDAEPEARILMNNLLRYADSHVAAEEAQGKQPGPDVYLACFQLVNEALDVSRVTDDQKKKFYFVNLKFHANGVFGGKKYDPAFNNVKFTKIPLGDWNFAGVPFHVVDSDNEEYLGGDPGAANSCIILRGKLQPKYPPKAEGILVNQKARKLHFLHTSAWALSIKETTSDPEYDTVYYRLVYDDGSTADIVAKNNVHIRDWWFKYMKAFTGLLKESPAGWVERNITTGVYGVIWVQSADNPHPEKTIKQIDIISAEKAVPLIFAITLEK